LILENWGTRVKNAKDLQRHHSVSRSGRRKTYVAVHGVRSKCFMEMQNISLVFVL